MNAESLYAPRDQPEKESKRERKKARKKERKKQGNQAFVETGPGPSLYFQRDFYTLTCTQKEMKDAKSYRVSPNITSVLSLSKPGFFFLHTFPINNVVYIIFWPWRPVDILWPSFDKGCSTRKLIFP